MPDPWENERGAQRRGAACFVGGWVGATRRRRRRGSWWWRLATRDHATRALLRVLGRRAVKRRVHWWCKPDMKVFGALVCVWTFFSDVCVWTLLNLWEESVLYVERKFALGFGWPMARLKRNGLAVVHDKMEVVQSGVVEMEARASFVLKLASLFLLMAHQLPCFQAQQRCVAVT